MGEGMNGAEDWRRKEEGPAIPFPSPNYGPNFHKLMGAQSPPLPPPPELEKSGVEVGLELPPLSISARAFISQKMATTATMREKENT